MEENKLREFLKENMKLAEKDIEDARPFGHSSYGMGVAVGERDAYFAILQALNDL